MNTGDSENLLGSSETRRCKYCGRELAAESQDWHKYEPFCSERCKLADLDRWFEGEYIVPGRPLDEGDENADP